MSRPVAPTQTAADVTPIIHCILQPGVKNSPESTNDAIDFEAPHIPTIHDAKNESRETHGDTVGRAMALFGSYSSTKNCFLFHIADYFKLFVASSS
ncbi:hypothetical protein Q1695_002901 [Nippostrongylus brasiliensis]|nr:hypothetical protein Q1695_002901 [Nippostrongylus brasiliensis]